jgi:hypothetical protein
MIFPVNASSFHPLIYSSHVHKSPCLIALKRKYNFRLLCAFVVHSRAKLSGVHGEPMAA